MAALSSTNSIGYALLSSNVHMQTEREAIVISVDKDPQLREKQPLFNLDTLRDRVDRCLSVITKLETRGPYALYKTETLFQKMSSDCSKWIQVINQVSFLKFDLRLRNEYLQDIRETCCGCCCCCCGVIIPVLTCLLSLGKFIDGMPNDKAQIKRTQDLLMTAQEEYRQVTADIREKDSFLGIRSAGIILNGINHLLMKLTPQFLSSHVQTELLKLERRLKLFEKKPGNISQLRTSLEAIDQSVEFNSKIEEMNASSPDVKQKDHEPLDLEYFFLSENMIGLTRHLKVIGDEIIKSKTLDSSHAREKRLLDEIIRKNGNIRKSISHIDVLADIEIALQTVKIMDMVTSQRYKEMIEDSNEEHSRDFIDFCLSIGDRALVYMKTESMYEIMHRINQRYMASFNYPSNRYWTSVFSIYEVIKTSFLFKNMTVQEERLTNSPLLELQPIVSSEMLRVFDLPTLFFRNIQRVDSSSREEFAMIDSIRAKWMLLTITHTHTNDINVNIVDSNPISKLKNPNQLVPSILMNFIAFFVEMDSHTIARPYLDDLIAIPNAIKNLVVEYVLGDPLSALKSPVVTPILSGLGHVERIQL